MTTAPTAGLVGVPRSPPSIAAVTLGAVSIALALLVSGYAAVAAGVIAVGLALAGNRRALPVGLAAAGIAPGVGAQAMKAMIG
ncbi:MAG: hypothetical protein FJ255_04155 [Phycisphaerae bacterium]|nr:hypothetical protein [Phycisphaerae bacterium]